MSKNMALMLQGKNDPISRIKKFLSPAESGVALNAIEEKMLDRLIYCKALLSERKYSQDQIEEKIKDKFGCSIWTARKDVQNTYSVFATVTEAYKKFTLRQHVEHLDSLIQQWSKDKSLAHLVPKLAAEKTRAVNAMPVDVENPDLPQPIIMININGSLDDKFQSVEQAREAADALIEMEKNIQDIDFEDVKGNE